MTHRKIAIFCLVCMLAACAGPVQIARNEKEGIKTGYMDPKLEALSSKYGDLLSSVYSKYRLADIGFVKEGLGFTSLADRTGQRFYYLLVDTRPSGINFDQNKSTGEERLRIILERYFSPDLKMLNRGDVAHDDFDGVAFGVSWPVRDFSQCNTKGGFVEYLLAYIDTNRFLSILDGSETVSDVLADSEVIVSLDLAPPKSIKLKY